MKFKVETHFRESAIIIFFAVLIGVATGAYVLIMTDLTSDLDVTSAVVVMTIPALLVLFFIGGIRFKEC